MADKKISALTSATTPLAGTEVLPIVQSGATVKVSVANLTAGRDMSCANFSYTGTLTGGTGVIAIGTNQLYKEAGGNFVIGDNATAGFFDGKLNVSGRLHVRLDNGANPTGFFWNTNTSANNGFVGFYTEASATIRGSITYNRAGGLTAYNTTSDYRSKTVNGTVQNALSKVALLKPSTGRMNGATQDIDFFVAHELQEIVPSAVTGEKDAVNEDNSPKYQMVDKSALIPLLTAAIQEQQAMIESLKARLDAANL